ncbi:MULTISPECIES: SDR family NAD(P)-dependent oxidoreductase [Streptomyces]|uniref:SDR family NAD(P)-dependent oxidoreductase n=1 Tax=Streptomyces TaxID=1883 RepID=UPI0029B8B329|nr:MULTISPECIES: SDR family oxidoreductase [Streptomyces]MDX3525207.1 SDR family oxidoreductase [Streptomyces sp. ID05-39B]MDX3582114.1 SDR family oxidoreductase [Streptomyces europaeiscabiei]
MPATTWDRHVQVNLPGTFRVCQVVAQVMVAARTGGWITVISSNLALGHTDYVSAYNVTKSALLSMVRSAVAEFGVHRIRVNAVLPGAIATAMTRQMLDEPGVTEGLLNLTPMGRLGRPSDVTSAVAYLVLARGPVDRWRGARCRWRSVHLWAARMDPPGPVHTVRAAVAAALPAAMSCMAMVA